MSATIPSPSRHDLELDQSAECESVLDFEFHALVIRSEAAGWSEDDVAIALLELANQHLDRIALKRKLLSQVIHRPANDGEQEA